MPSFLSSSIQAAASGSFIARNRHFLVLLVYPLYFWGFQFVERAVPTAQYVMYCRVDDFIPFLPLAIYPYLFWYVYIAGAVALTAFTDRKAFYQLMLFLYVGMGTCYGLYLIFPNGQNLRPELGSLGEGLAYDLLRWLYRIDTPTNSNPSIHVIDSIAVYLALTRHPWFARRPVWQGLNMILCATIIASTVLVKQHSIIDVLCGFGLSGLLFLGIMRYELPARLVALLRAPAPPAGAGEASRCQEDASGGGVC